MVPVFAAGEATGLAPGEATGLAAGVDSWAEVDSAYVPPCYLLYMGSER